MVWHFFFHSGKSYLVRFCSLIQIPFSGRKMSSPSGLSSSRLWHDSTSKWRNIVARTTFSSIRAKRWPAAKDSYRENKMTVENSSSSFLYKAFIMSLHSWKAVEMTKDCWNNLCLKVCGSLSVLLEADCCVWPMAWTCEHMLRHNLSHSMLGQRPKHSGCGVGVQHTISHTEDLLNKLRVK